jgi:hypothetical protein
MGLNIWKHGTHSFQKKNHFGALGGAQKEKIFHEKLVATHYLMQDSVHVFVQAIEKEIQQFLGVVLRVALKLGLKLPDYMFESARSNAVAVALVEHLQ